MTKNWYGGGIGKEKIKTHGREHLMSADGFDTNTWKIKGSYT